MKMTKKKLSKSSSETKTDLQKSKLNDVKNIRVGSKVKITSDRYNDKDWIGKTGTVRRIIRDGSIDLAEFITKLGFKNVMFFVSFDCVYKKEKIRCMLPFREQDLQVL